MSVRHAQTPVPKRSRYIGLLSRVVTTFSVHVDVPSSSVESRYFYYIESRAFRKDKMAEMGMGKGVTAGKLASNVQKKLTRAQEKVRY